MESVSVIVISSTCICDYLALLIEFGLELSLRILHELIVLLYTLRQLLNLSFLLFK